MATMTVVAATDFSNSARAAVERAALIARDHKARLSLVYGFDEASWENLRSLATPKKNLFTGQPLHQAGERIRTAAEELGRKYGIAASRVAAIGHASAAIAATADEVNASLIVLGPHSRRPGDRLYLGSTALKLARIAACPVLVVCGSPAVAGYARCLVGIDFSQPSERAALVAARLFPAAEITLLHAVQSVEGPLLLTGALREAINAAKKKLREEALQRLTRMFAAGQPGRLDSGRRIAVIGSASRALLREAVSRS